MRIYPSDIMIIPLVLSSQNSIPTITGRFPRGQSPILLQTVCAVAPSLAQQKAYANPEGALVDKKEGL